MEFCEFLSLFHTKSGSFSSTFCILAFHFIREFALLIKTYWSCCIDGVPTCLRFTFCSKKWSQSRNLVGKQDTFQSDNHNIRNGQQPSKNYVKYVIRQKRADAKKALKDLLYKSGSSKFSLQNKETWKLDGNDNCYGDEEYHSDSFCNKGQAKSRQRSGKSQKKVKRKIRRESFSEDFDGHAETMFQATFGNRWYTWSFRNWQGSSCANSTSGFEWREHSNWTNSRTRKWKSASDVESDDDSCCVGTLSDRSILDLPPTGPLEIEDVKKAFRLSALKWHPDKHQGPSQAVAEEKFKLCLNAYKSLCNALSPA